MCRDGTVVSSSVVCDGKVDCSDELDEMFCERQLDCKLDQFRY